MKKYIHQSAGFFLTLTLLLGVTQVTEAYVTTNQEAFTINSKTGVYTIDFRFGHAKHDIYIPVIANLSTEKKVGTLSYQILNDKSEVAKGSVVGIVLSKSAKVQNGMYVIPKGKMATFTLLTFYTPSSDETGAQFRTQVTQLPFSFDGKQELQLNPSELKYYTTELLPLTK